MDSNYKKSLALVLRYEGGKVDDPLDPGGRTNQGVTQRVYDAYRSKKKLKPLSVYLMSELERDDIYKFQYWDAARCGELPLGVDFVVFDGAVNSGVNQSVKWLQRALLKYGYVGLVDGHIGLKTIEAAVKCEDRLSLVEDIEETRLRFMQSLRTWNRFGKGWASRVADVTQQARAMDWKIKKQSLFTPSDPNKLGAGNSAVAEDANPEDTTAIADAATGVGSITTVLAQTTSALMPLSDSSEKIQNLIFFLTIAGVAITVIGSLLGLFARRNNSQRRDSLSMDVH